MTWNDKEYIHFLATVAITCCRFERPVDCSDASLVADYINAVLHILFHKGKYTVFGVVPLAYPTANKVPLIIKINDVAPRLLWFYPSQDSDSLADEVCGLLGDLIPRHVSVSA